MPMETVLQMNNKLSELNQTFKTQTSTFLHQINLHETKFTHQDLDQFEKLLLKIKKEINSQIGQFFNEKISQRSQNYEQKISEYKSGSLSNHEELVEFRDELSAKAKELKKQQIRGERVMQHFSLQFHLNSLKKRFFQHIKNNARSNAEDKQQLQMADKLYQKNLFKKVFFPWRSLCYKSGYVSTIEAQTQQDIQNIHQQYSSIIQLLKNKIQSTDQLVKVKRAAKEEFSYALSKNMMKTISNLSLEVISLNQMALRDGEYDNTENQLLMDQVGQIVNTKVRQVHTYKQALLQEHNDATGQRVKKIRFA